MFPYCHSLSADDGLSPRWTAAVLGQRESICWHADMHRTEQRWPFAQTSAGTSVPSAISRDVPTTVPCSDLHRLGQKAQRGSLHKSSGEGSLPAQCQNVTSLRKVSVFKSSYKNAALLQSMSDLLSKRASSWDH